MKNQRIMNEEEIRLRRELARKEQERDRSLKWFFVNLFVLIIAIGVAALILWLVPKIVAKIATKDYLNAQGVLKPQLPYDVQIRLEYIKWGMFVFVFAWVTTWIFWALFRFRKWSVYQHEVEVLKEELKKLEQENKK